MARRKDLEQQLEQLAADLDRALRRTTPVDWPDVELTMTQLKTLASLLDSPLRMGDVASLSGISLSAATAMVDRLVDRGFVRRAEDTQDRRVVVCELTGEGRALLERFWQVREQSLRALAGQMTDDELQTVVAALRIMTEAARRATNDTDL